jgi:hypothetical protein
LEEMGVIGRLESIGVIVCMAAIDLKVTTHRIGVNRKLHPLNDLGTSGGSDRGTCLPKPQPSLYPGWGLEPRATLAAPVLAFR